MRLSNATRRNESHSLNGYDILHLLTNIWISPGILNSVQLGLAWLGLARLGSAWLDGLRPLLHKLPDERFLGKDLKCNLIGWTIQDSFPKWDVNNSFSTTINRRWIWDKILFLRWFLVTNAFSDSSGASWLILHPFWVFRSALFNMIWTQAPTAWPLVRCVAVQCHPPHSSFHYT
jgi:hypothetical protein